MKNKFCDLDMDRLKRQGFPEVIYCPGKTTRQIIEIVKRFVSAGPVVSAGQTRACRQAGQPPVMCTRTDRKTYLTVKRRFPQARFYPVAKIIAVPYGKYPVETGRQGYPEAPFVCVVTAGTADIPVAEESAVVCGLLGTRVERIYDVGVAGVHRILKHKDTLSSACCVIVVAGMEGALPSVVGGLVPCPVVGVPTSVGYGANFSGLSALLTMLNSCAANVCTVNIDDGFGAGVIAHLIARGQSARGQSARGQSARGRSVRGRSVSRQRRNKKQ
ncbi:MAG: nickel pincer cofactor biosynthesis protein LarB [Elusimicrobia bacterium]|nr:nickel pincer cofactor biosynthesis protein LarB [Elusimicrobiota bacterium]